MLSSNADVLERRRGAKSSFDAQFHRGRCPDYFYQLDNECLYFATSGKIYAWQQAQKACEQKVAQLTARQAAFAIGQSKLRPIPGIRQLILNTPEKTKILEAIYREYDEVSYAVRLPSDLNPAHRCNDGQEDHWPQYCQNPTQGSNTTCFDTSELGSDHICLRQVDCAKPYLRLACEYTLPGQSDTDLQRNFHSIDIGNPVLTTSKFRQCPRVRGLGQRLTIWAWILIAVGAMLLLLLILGGVLAFLRNSKTESPLTKRSISEGRHTEEPGKT